MATTDTISIDALVEDATNLPRGFVSWKHENRELIFILSEPFNFHKIIHSYLYFLNFRGRILRN